MTHFQLYNVSSIGWEEGPICQHSRGLRLVAVVVGEPSHSCWIEELGSYPEVLAVSAFGGGGSSELSMLHLQCLSDICHNYQVSELSHPRLTRHCPSEASSLSHTCVTVTGPVGTVLVCRASPTPSDPAACRLCEPLLFLVLLSGESGSLGAPRVLCFLSLGRSILKASTSCPRKS